VSTPELETRFHSFVLKVWSEIKDEKTGSIGWRGYITHVPSGRRVYVTELNEFGEFIRPYLTEMGADLKHGLRDMIDKWF
jgi:hypothetical protein